MYITTRPKLLRLLPLIALLFMFSILPLESAHAQPSDPVTVTRHAQLGFTTSIPVSGSRHDSAIAGAVSYTFGFTGTANVAVNMGADIALTYDPTQVRPGNTLPMTISYTPTSSSVSVDISGIATVDFTGCLNCPAHPSVTLAAGSGSFIPPMTGDPSASISGTSSKITISVVGLDMVDLSLSSGLTLAPVAAGTLPGLGGAAGVVSVSGATLIQPNPLIPILEWDTAGQSVNAMVQLPATPGPTVDVVLQPVLHWLGTSASVNLNIHLDDALQILFCAIVGGIPCIGGFLLSDPSPISLFSGSLGPVYTSIGLDTMIGNAIGGVAGSLVAGQVAAGNLPIPLLQPPLSTIPPFTLGSIDLPITVPFDFSIASAVSDATVLAGATASYPLTLGLVQGAPAPVTLSASGLPSGANALFTSNSFAPPGSTTLQITTSTTGALGDFPVTVKGQAGSVSHQITVNLHIFDYTISIAPSDRTVIIGLSTTYTVGVSLVPGSTTIGLPNIPLSISGLPADASTSGFPASLSLGTSATFTVQTGTTSLGDFTFTVTGMGSRTATATLHIITPAQATQNLIDIIDGYGLSNGTTSALEGRLRQIVHILTDDNPNNDISVCGKLTSFISTVNNFLAQGRLTAAQAAQLISAANLILASLHCT